jgi:hypothetical protein
VGVERSVAATVFAAVGVAWLFGGFNKKPSIAGRLKSGRRRLKRLEAEEAEEDYGREATFIAFFRHPDMRAS